MRRRLAIGLGLLITVLAPASASALTVGLSEQQAASWSDARLRALGVHYARLTVPWDAATSEPAKVQAWLDAVAAAGATPHIAFEHLRSDRCPNSPCVVPSRSAYASAVRAFIAKWPQVKTYTTWNEANHGSQPVADRPETVAGYWEELRAACPSCTVVAGDVVDSGSYVRWLEDFAAAASPAPTLWGLHNYSDVTYGTSSRTDAALAAVSGDLWIEETGGLVARWDTRGRVLFSASESDAAAAIDRAFQIATERPRITRMYVYQWKAWPTDTFDAGLARPNGTLRPSYDAFKRDLAALGSSSGGGSSTTSSAATLKWSVKWASRGRLVVRARCLVADKRCRGKVTITLRTRAKGSSSTKTRRLAVRTYRTSSSKATATIRVKVSSALRRRASRAEARSIKLAVRPTLPAGAKSSVVVRVKRP